MKTVIIIIVFFSFLTSSFGQFVDADSLGIKDPFESVLSKFYMSECPPCDSLQKFHLEKGMSLGSYTQVLSDFDCKNFFYQKQNKEQSKKLSFFPGKEYLIKSFRLRLNSRFDEIYDYKKEKKMVMRTKYIEITHAHNQQTNIAVVGYEGHEGDVAQDNYLGSIHECFLEKHKDSTSYLHIIVANNMDPFGNFTYTWYKISLQTFNIAFAPGHSPEALKRKKSLAQKKFVYIPWLESVKNKLAVEIIGYVFLPSGETPPQFIEVREGMAYPTGSWIGPDGKTVTIN